MLASFDSLIAQITNATVLGVGGRGRRVVSGTHYNGQYEEDAPERGNLFQDGGIF